MRIVPEKAEELFIDEIDEMKPIESQEKAMRGIYRALQKGKNVVVYGIEGSGKTFLGRKISEREEIPIFNGRYLNKEDEKIIEYCGAVIIDDASQNDISLLSSLDSQIIFLTEEEPYHPFKYFPNTEVIMLENMEYRDVITFFKNYSIRSDPIGRYVAGVLATSPGNMGKVVNYFLEITGNVLEDYGIEEYKNLYAYSKEKWEQEFENEDKEMMKHFTWFSGDKNICKKIPEISLAPIPKTKVVGIEKFFYTGLYSEIFALPNPSYHVSSHTCYR